MSGAHLHLDPLGGIAGDMFAAALIDLEPALFDGLVPLLRSVGLADDVAVSLLDHNDGVLQGRRFVVDDPRERAPVRKPGAFVFQRGSQDHGPHVPFVDVVRRIQGGGLSTGARERAVDVFTRLARAEGSVHGIADVADVVFHEVGAQDSVADVVTAAILLDRLCERHGSLTATVSSLPLGSGRVQTAHGELPVPAPATLALLQGHRVHDDGRPGERVTPTGAAIVSHLVPFPAQHERRPAGVVVGSGIGFGTRTLSGLSNIVRVTLTSLGSKPVEASWVHEAILEIACDIDDMTGEELALGAEHLRRQEGVVDVVVVPCFMKKGRPASRLCVVCRPAARHSVISEIFKVTSTLGVRVMEAERALLSRELLEVGGVRVKRAARPGGATFKADVDDVVAATLSERRASRLAAENTAHDEDD
ncbi:MAG: LarC family nickel insertion protein [Deltaproteobacteria bacterium]|nr:LarC family nickel insertion protein [Deltaproteobacteria bacterium]